MSDFNLLIDGQMVPGDSKMPVLNPATEEVIAQCPRASKAQLSTLKFAELVKDILPQDVLNVITDANDLGGEMTKHPDIRKISFTGSTATGQKVMASAAETLKRITLELGGNDASIVLDDVDPKKVAPGIFEGAFQNSGQVCLAIKRLYVHESVYDQICDELVTIANNTVVDDGAKQGTKLGPVLPVIKYSDNDDVIRRANATNYGLGASVWSSNLERAHGIASQIEAGTVRINKHLDMAPHIPFGGAKQSGIGVEFAEEGLAEFTQLQIINAARE